MKMKTITCLAAVLVLAGTASADWLITDDMESTGGWALSGGAISWVDTSGGPVGGLSATAGSEYLNVTATGSRTIDKIFTGFTFASSGTINVSIDMGDRTDTTLGTKQNDPRLYADFITADGLFTGGELVGAASGTDPVDGWQTWTLSVDLSTITNAAWGSTVGFSIRARNDSAIGGQSLSYDNLSIEYIAIPEPATLGMVAFFGGGMLYIRRKFHQS